MFTAHHINGAVIYSSAPAFWPPAIDCCSSPLLLLQQKKKRLRLPAALPVQGACRVKAPATSPVHCQPTPGQGDRRGTRILTSVPPGHLHLPQFPLHPLCRITPPRMHNHHVNLLTKATQNFILEVHIIVFHRLFISYLNLFCSQRWWLCNYCKCAKGWKARKLKVSHCFYAHF